MSTAYALTASLEDYLEAIYRIVEEKQVARAKDISARMNVHKSSVTGALKGLAARELVNYDPYELITLTKKGQQLAREVIRRHEVLRDFFVTVLAVNPTRAEENACRIEHGIDKETLERLIDFIEFVDACPRGGSKWIRGFAHYCTEDREHDKCEECVSLVLDDIKESKTLEGGEGEATVALSDLRPGEKGRIVKIAGEAATKKRLVEMGVLPGTMVEVERVAPLGDPMGVKIRGYHLSLRKEEASNISVVRESPGDGCV